MKTKLALLPDWRTLLSAILIVAAFPPWNLWPLLWIALLPWFSAIRRSKSPYEASIQGVWLSYFMSLGGFYWVAFVLKEFGGLSWSISILGLQVFCIFGQPQFFLFAPLIKKIHPHFNGHSKGLNPFGSSWKWACLNLFLVWLYVGIDWIVPKMFLDTLGHGFYSARHLRQLADLGSASLLTFLVFLVNLSIWLYFFQKPQGQTKPGQAHGQNGKDVLSLGVVTAAILLAGWVYGYIRYQQIHQLELNAPHSIQAAAIQANIGDFDKVASERGVASAATKIIDIYTSMTRQALQLDPKPDFIIWPETAYPSTFRKPHSRTEIELDQRINQYVQSLEVPLLFGGYDRMNQSDYNAFFFLTPQGNLQVYRKNILLLFGEYIPGADRFQLIKDTFPQVGNFGRGSGPEVLEIQTQNPQTGNVRVGPIICYESLFPNYIAESARKGAQMILNITNDSWFGQWGEPQLHLALTIFRSVESRLPMVRTTNTGISALILPNGEITHATEIGQQQIMNVRVPLIAPVSTLVKLWGDWHGIFSLILGIMGTLIFVIKFNLLDQPQTESQDRTP